MRMLLFSVYDSKANYFAPPFLAKTQGEALRSFQELVKDERSTVSKYPEDFDLFKLGEYDDGTGKIEPLDTPQHIEKAVLLKAVQNNS